MFFKKVLIANRGEIALRIIRTCKELGIKTVAVHSEADAQSLHVRFADEAVCIGPASPTESYLKVPGIIAAAEITGADAIHPGYGFLSENAEFADTCKECGLTFIGPTSKNMGQWGEKVSARALAKSLGLPLNEGSAVLDDGAHAVREAERIGYPVMLKAAGGGGGRGMKVIHDSETLLRVFPQAHAEALAGFNNGDLYLERFVSEPKHIEFQVMCDGKGKVWVLGERDCSIQRRHQKVLEEAPSVTMSEEMRKDMTATIKRAMLESNYISAGTLEFLMDERGNLSFMEMNTRIQVEHPVTEMITGKDLIAAQLQVAAGQSLDWEDEVPLIGHAIEVRVNAEDPESYVPWPGLITDYHAPGGTGIRVESGVTGGIRVPREYDSLIAKIISYGATRDQAITRMRRALSETWVEGIRTNISTHQRILEEEDFQKGNYSTRFLERWKK